ncbi:amidase [Mucilaginibacter paludis]|uniref:Amidase n=1 Tax=Mucilaginibacter paludis DSM 18603 TaxID=714943 RepID=H1YC30_9SPHI|nr:amidase [Mucilaginibacter paludis]EHQ29593.1 Amidase [Mucilaginibacter paludis DSM 18603]
MKRRNFLKTGSIAGLALTTLMVGDTACNTPAPADEKKPEKPQEHQPAVAYNDFVLNEITIDALQQKMKSGAYTSRSICELYLKRIDAIDKKGPRLNAVIELNPEALQIADELDQERKAGKIRGPMHGIPVLIKDNINTGDKMTTTAGALALEGNYAFKDAFIIQQLRKAGAVLLGKTNLSEWANFRSNRSTSAWSSRGGQTKMPYILDRNPSGSSSGSGSAVAANLCAVAIGTETDGSVVSPASVNSIVGIKPTVGLLSRSGIIPISKTQDTAGPMARTVTDAAILLGALTGVDAEDAVTASSLGKAKGGYTTYLDVNGLQGKRIGIEKSFLKGNDAVVALIQNAIEVLKRKGATVVEVELLKQLKNVGQAEFTVLIYEFKDGVDSYLAKARARVKSLKEVVDFNNRNAAKAMPFFKQETLELALTKGGLKSKEYLAALKKTTGTSRNAIDSILKANRLDAIAGPTNGLACCIDLANGDYDTGFSFSSPAAMAGYPHITVPMGAVHNLPIGFSFLGTAYNEGELITLAYAFEQANKKRIVPQFISSLMI